MKKHNFSPGPAALPAEAIERARADLVDFEGTGMSVVEQSHRAEPFERVQGLAITLLRELLAVPDTHEVLLLQGGARQQFAMLPLNFLGPGAVADYVITGHWAKLAYEAGACLGNARVVCDTRGADGMYRRVPRPSEVPSNSDAVYLHLCSNNTVYGTQWTEFPAGDVPLAVDMTSDIMSRPLDISRFGMIYAAAQKNLGPPGVTAAIIRKDLLARARKDIPDVWSYRVHAQHASLYNTPAMFGVAMMRHVLEHARAIGGLPAITAANREKASRLYRALDSRPEQYRVSADLDSRSAMNVVFRLATPADDARFLAESKRRGMVGLEGHRAIGGLRASIYNWTPLESVDALVELVTEFR